MNRLNNFQKMSRIGVIFLVLVAMGTAVAHKAHKGKSQPMETKHWMQGVMKPASGALKTGLASAPGDEEAWELLAMHAAVMNESSYVLMADGRCPDDIWSKASTETLRNGSVSLISAIQSRNYNAAKAAFEAMAGSCKGCHEVHKPKDEE